MKIDTESHTLMMIAKDTCPKDYIPKCFDTSNPNFQYCNNCSTFQQQFCRVGVATLEIKQNYTLQNWNYHFCMAKYLEPRFGDWKDIDGTFGLLNSYNTEISDFYSLMESNTNKMFALELYGKGNDLKKDGNNDQIKQSIMYVGGYEFQSEQEKENLYWSESGIWKEDYLSEFPIPLYHLSICDIDLMQQISSQMNAIVSTSQKCMYLPASLWNATMIWIGADCGEFLYPPQQPTCTITIKNGLEQIPPFQFQFSEFGKKFYIPLTLLLEPTSTKNVYSICLMVSEFDQIVLGTKVLQDSFKTIFDLQTRKVGFIPLNNYSVEAKNNYTQCSQMISCDGSFTYDKQSNKCLPPDCSSYLFQMNGPLGQCVYSKLFVYPVLLVLFSFCSIEVVLAFVYRNFTDKMSIPFLHD
eukprot:TRINITY_DN3443_c0_g2_i3.p1 TRINITY_DN3443_c0_g2~~TRINITY_DN3443_c0_g2_i3.p1  ORF type:complete len:458 (+),score=74.94 TRINITY_DN3443_c0_g2_i3:144-1376(+)